MGPLFTDFDLENGSTSYGLWPNLAYHLFLYNPKAEDDSHIFKCFKKNQKENNILWHENYMKFKFLCP